MEARSVIKHTKHFIEQSWLLVAASFVFGLLLATTNALWGGKIEQNQQDKFNNLARAMLTEAFDFEAIEDVEIAGKKGKTVKVVVKKAVDNKGRCTGWAFVCHGPGFADKIKLVVTANGTFEKLAGFGVLSSNETPGFGDKIKNDYYRDQFAGAPVAELTLSKTGDDKKIDNEIIAISGATVSSEAVVKILNNYIGQIKNEITERGSINNGK